MTIKRVLSQIAVCVCVLTGLSACESASDSQTAGFHTLSGQIIGLREGAAILVGGRADRPDMILAADGSFTFPIAMKSGDGYDVTVIVQPTGRTRCQVKNGVGKVKRRDINDIAINCRASSDNDRVAVY